MFLKKMGTFSMNGIKKIDIQKYFQNKQMIDSKVIVIVYGFFLWE